VLAAVVAVLVIKLAACSTRSDQAATGVEPAMMVPSVGEPLKALGDLGTIAAAKDTAFVLVPAPGSKGVRLTVARSIEGARDRLAAKGVSVGLFTLNADAPDYASTGTPWSLPGVFVICKDRGKQMVTGEITEARLLQAYVASSRRAGGCNCGKSASTCGGGK
jgi:hypothetical protein